MKAKQNSIVEMAKGAIMERIDYEMSRVIDNIADVNTKATAKRKITIVIELTPDDSRQNIQASATAKSTLAPTNPITTSLFVTSDGNGEAIIAEMIPQIPGQLNIQGDEQEQPRILKLVSSFDR